MSKAAAAVLFPQILPHLGFVRRDARGNRKYAVKGEELAPTVVGQLACSQYVVDLVNRILGGFDDIE